MMKINKKMLTLLAATILLLTCSVSSTVAFLVDNTGNVTNTFTPTKAGTEIEETFDNSKKSSITVKQTNDGTVSVFVRVALIGNWYDEQGNIVDAWTPIAEEQLGTGWFKMGDYYYYQSAVLPGGKTGNLLAAGVEISGTDPERPGQHLIVTVIQQSIQAEGTNSEGQYAAEEAWGVKVTKTVVNGVTTYTISQ